MKGPTEIERRAVAALALHGPMTASMLGSLLWNTARLFPHQSRHLAAPAGAVLRRLERHGMVSVENRRWSIVWRHDR
jgi:hypothetical protein